MGLSLRARLLAAILALTAIIGVLIVSGWTAMSTSHSALEGVYLHRLVPMEQLKKVSDAYAINIVDTAHKVRGASVTWEEGLPKIEEASRAIRAGWQAYTATEIVEAEKKLIDQVERDFVRADAAVAKLAGILRGRNQAELDAFVTRELYPAVDPVTGVIDRLVNLQIDVARSEYAASQRAHATSVWVMIASIVAAFVAVVFATLTVLKGVIRPLSVMTDAMGILAEGRFETEVPGLGRRDEIGRMAKAVQVFKENGLERIRIAAEQEREREARERRAAHVVGVTTNFQGTVAGLVQALSSAAAEMEAAASSMSATAEQTNQQAVIVAAASEQASASVQTVAAATEELSASIDEIGSQAAQSHRIASRAVEDAKRTDDTVRQLAETAARIGEVVNLIQDIASQTNLLALNATIEAARAGEAGKGFAVVASEVKSLANQTARATDEIASHIAEIQAATKGAVTAIKGIGSVIMEVNEIASTIAAAVEEQGAATREISRNVQQAAAGTQEVSSNIAGVQRAASDAGSAASSVLDAAQDLSRQSTILDSEVRHFVEDLKAG